VLLHLKNSSLNSDTAISIDAQPSRDAELNFSEGGTSKWQFRSHDKSSTFRSFSLSFLDDLHLDTPMFRINAPKAGGASFTYWSGHFSPYADATYDLGLSTYRWRSVRLVNAPIVTSDARAKSEVRPIEHGLADLLALEPKSYTLHAGDTSLPNQLGLIAQELAKVIPEVVDQPDDPDALMGVKYSELVPVLVQGIKEQQAIIDDQATELANVKDRLARIEALLSQAAL